MAPLWWTRRAPASPATACSKRAVFRGGATPVGASASDSRKDEVRDAMPAMIERVAAGWALTGGFGALLIVLVTSLNVGAFMVDRLTRLAGVHVTALPGYEDLVRLLVSGVALMFLPYCQLRGGHIRVELLERAMPPGLARALDTLWLLLTVLMALFLAYWMTMGLLETRSDNVLSRVLGWREWPFYLPGVLSMLLWAAVAAAQAVGVVRHG